jgi:MFS family permease
VALRPDFARHFGDLAGFSRHYDRRREREEMKDIHLRDENGKLYFGWLVIVMSLFLGVIGYSCVVSVIGVFILPVTGDLGFQIGDFVVWTTIMSLTSIAYLTIASRFYNARTIRPILLVCAVLGAVGFFGFSRATELWHFYVFAMPMGICFGGMTATPASVLVSNWFGPKCKGFAMGLFFSGTSVLAMLLIPLMNKIVSTSGWRIAYFGIAISLIVICIPLILLLAKWSPDVKGIRRMGDEQGSRDVAASELTGIAFKQGLKRVSTWLMFLSGTLVVVASSAMLTHTQTFLVMSGYSPAFSANVMSGMIGALVVGGVLVGRYCDRYKLQIAAVLTCVLFAVAYVSQIGIPQAGWLIAVLIVGYGLGCTAVNILPTIIAYYMFGEKELNGYIGYINVFIGIGGAFGSTIVGKLLDSTGSYTAPFLLCGGLLLIAALIRGIVTSKRFKYDLDSAE